MQIFTLEVNEKVVIGDNVIQLGIDAPRKVSLIRGEAKLRHPTSTNKVGK